MSHLAPRFRVLHMHPDLAVGGGQVLLLRTLRALDQLAERVPHFPRFEHHVCAVRPDLTMAEEYRRAGVRVHCLDVSGPLRAAAALPRLMRLAMSSRIDLIHTNNTYSDRTLGLLVARGLGIPAVNTLHSQPPELFRPSWRELRGRPIAQRAWGALRDRPLSLAGAFIAVSESVRDGWGPHLASMRVRADRICVIHPPLPERQRTRTDPAALRSMFDPPASHLLLAVGRLVGGKGHEHLIGAMEILHGRLPDVGLLIAGEGPQRPELERAISAAGLGGRIKLLGLRDDVADLMAACDCFIFPTHAEGFGLVALEAMAQGKAVLASDLPVLRSLIEHGETGLLTTVARPDLIAGALEGLLREPAQRERIGAAARASVERRFGAAATGWALAEVYARALRIDLPAREEPGAAGFGARDDQTLCSA